MKNRKIMIGYLFCMLFFACSQSIELDQPLAVEKQEQGETHLQIAITRTSEDNLVEIKSGILILVDYRNSEEWYVEDKIQFTSEDLKEGTLSLVTKACKGEYKMLVIANPTKEMKDKILKSSEPWNIEYPFTREQVDDPGELLNVFSNTMEDFTNNSNQINIEYQSEDNPIKVSLRLKRILACFYLEDYVGYVTDRVNPDMNVDNIQFKLDGFHLLTVPNGFYLWERWGLLNEADPNSYFPFSVYKKKETDLGVIYKYSNVLVKGGKQYAVDWNSNFNPEERFGKGPFYMPDNFALTYMPSKNEYVAYQCKTTELIIRLKAEKTFYSHKYTNEGPIYIRKEEDKSASVIFENKEGYMYLTYVFRDPNHKKRYNDKEDLYPSVFRGTKYTITFNQIRSYGGNFPRNDMDRYNVDRDLYNVLGELTNNLSTRVKQGDFLELAIDAQPWSE